MNSIISRRKFLAATATVGVVSTLPIQLARADVSESANEVKKDLADKTSSAYKQPTGETELQIANLEDLEYQASKVIPEGAFAFISQGADNQVTLQENRNAFQRIRLLPHYLSAQAAPDLSTELLGQKLSMPIITAPMGAHGLAHISGELGSAKGTGEAGTLFTASTAANETIEDMAEATTGPKWFQLYLHNERNLSRDLLKRAKAAGYSAIVFTIDAFAPGASDETVRLGFSFPQSLPLVNSGGSVFKSSLGWDDVEFIQETTDLPLILKGVVTPELAEKAIKYGAAGIQVSNHGGRGLDGVPAAIELLPDIAAVVNKRVPIIFDSGIRRGTDVFKALALGADAVALGRPVLYGLALGGSTGVKSVYDRISDELSRAMMIAGVANIQEINNKFIYDNTLGSLV